MGVLETALNIVFRENLPVFPCGEKKLPAISKKNGGHGFYDASLDENEVRRLFKLTRYARLVGVPCGSTTDFDVLDIDYRNDGGVWEMENAHRLPRTRQHTTMSGGRHYLFRHAPGVRNSAGATTAKGKKKGIADGVDVRGDGGYIIYPPSLGYYIQDSAPIADWPDWLLQLVLARKPEEEQRPEPIEAAAELTSSRLEGLTKSILSRVSGAGQGGKHYALRNAALSLGGIQQRVGWSDEQVVGMLMQALPSADDWAAAKVTALWGLENGRKRPLVLQDRPQYTNGHAKPNGSATPQSTKIVADPRPIAPGIENPRRATIRVLNGLRHKAADEALDAMAKAAVPFYQRDRSLVRAALAKAKTSDGTVIEIAGIISVTAPILGRAMGMVAEWEKVLKDGEIVRIDPPKEVVEQVAAMSGDWPFPPLTGVISTPTLRPDGTVLSATGYDHATGLVMIAPPKMPAVPSLPTRADADGALDLLQGLISEFPFSDNASRSVALSMILTAVLRGALLPAVPMHVATAPQPGTGKSFLGDIASAVATGERCAVIAIAPNPEETEKRLIGAALAGQQIIALDNVSEMLSGDFLNQVTERPLLQLRPLGTSAIIRIANSFTVFANGNNLSAPADLVRRTLVCRLDANMENPEERTFESNPVKAVLGDRGLYVAACLTIGRAYLAAGSPYQCRQLPSFERWSDLVRSALIWLGMPDPCSSMEMARAEDPIRASRAGLFQAWEKEIILGVPGHTTAELVEAAEHYDGIAFQCATFRAACLVIAAERSGTVVSPRRLGKWLSANNNNRVGDLKLTVDRSDVARPRWILTKG